MPSYGKKSADKLSTCHPALRLLFNAVIQRVDCSILQGVRGREEQDRLFKEGRSQKQWPDSKHNVEIEGELSNAVDVAPYPINWEDLPRFYMFIGYVKAVADELGIKIRCGADWDMDGWTDDQRFHDLVHVEYLGMVNK